MNFSIYIMRSVLSAHNKTDMIILNFFVQTYQNEGMREYGKFHKTFKLWRPQEIHLQEKFFPTFFVKTQAHFPKITMIYFFSQTRRQSLKMKPPFCATLPKLEMVGDPALDNPYPSQAVFCDCQKLNMTEQRTVNLTLHGNYIMTVTK